jgi:hypothetical protein
MLGFGDVWVVLAYVLCLASTLLCIVYAGLRWNEDESMPSAQHPAGEDTTLDDEV